MIKSSRRERPFLFRVGIVSVVHKSIAHQLLAPAPAAKSRETELQYNAIRLGETQELREGFLLYQ